LHVEAEMDGSAPTLGERDAGVPATSRPSYLGRFAVTERERTYCKGTSLIAPPGAGWHRSPNRSCRPTSLIPLPPKFRELSPVENVWKSLRGSWPLSCIYSAALSSTLLLRYEQFRRAAMRHRVRRATGLLSSYGASRRSALVLFSRHGRPSDHRDRVMGITPA